MKQYKHNYKTQIMEVFDETILALGAAYNKLKDANINANNIERVLYKLHALKEDIAMMDYQITDIIVTTMPEELTFASYIYNPTPQFPNSEINLLTHPVFPGPSRRSPYPLQTPHVPAQATFPPPLSPSSTTAFAAPNAPASAAPHAPTAALGPF